MRNLRHVISLAVLCGAALWGATFAEAQTCTITGISAASANAGRYTGAAISKSLSGTVVTVTRTGSGTTCQGQIAFQRFSTPAVMTGALGSTLPYGLQASSQSLIGNNSWSATYKFSYSGSSPSFTVDLSSLTLVVPAGTAPAAGGYDDTNISIVVFDGWSSTTPIGGGSAFFVNAAVNPSCTIANGAVATDPVPVQIPVSMAGVVNTGAITRSYNQVVCNAPTDITMTSQNGGLVNTVPASGGRTNVIPYSAQASFGGATSTLNTAASSMVTGKLNTTTGANGTMNVSISAQQPALPMMTGAYNDRLTITLTPQ